MIFQKNNPDLDNDGDVDDADLATAMANYTGPGSFGKTPAQGDTDNDGDVDDADLANIFAAYTGTVAPPVEIDASEVTENLRRHGRVDLAGVDVVRGGVEIPGEYTELVCTRGNRPVIKPKLGEFALWNGSQHIDRLHVSGIAAESDGRSNAAGFRFRINGQEGRYINNLEIIDCKVEGFDDNYQVVDDWARKRGEFAPGRIHMVFALNISGLAYGTDAHSVGLYTEGMADGWIVTQSAFHRSGWLEPSDRNKMSHAIYAQRFNGLCGDCSGNVFSESAANAVQFRAGVARFSDNIMAGNSLGPYIAHKGGEVKRNVILDQMDIRISADDTWRRGDRGHGFIFAAPHLDVEDNVVARRHGSLKRVPAYKGLYNADSFERNTAVAWAVDHLNFEIDGRKHTDVGSNRTVTSDPGVPQFTAIDRYLSRERGQPFEATGGFIDRCREAVA